MWLVVVVVIDDWFDCTALLVCYTDLPHTTHLYLLTYDWHELSSGVTDTCKDVAP